MPTVNTASAVRPSLRPRRSNRVSTDGRPRVRREEASTNITAIASQRALSSFTTRSVCAELAPASAGFSSEPNTSAITPITRALADRGTQSERMGETLGPRSGARTWQFAAETARSCAESLRS